MRNSWQQFGKILSVVLRHRLDLLVPTRAIPYRFARVVLRLVQTILPTPQLAPGERLRDAFVELGPVYIKLGQLLSTRRDLLPLDIADALATLQDQVPPIANFDVSEFVSKQLETPSNEVFEQLSTEPLASASIAQVHTAQLKTGEEVVVKLVRPGIDHQIRQDMALLKSLAQRLHENVEGAWRLQLPQIANDHETVLLQELNMFSEARNQIQLRRNFAESSLLYVPRVHAQFTREHLLVMERVYGVPINRVQVLNDANVDLKVLAHKGVETFFTQVFEHNFFHADMHPGNVLVDITTPHDPKYIALDCAIIGTLTEADQNYLAQNLLAFFHRDYRRVVSLHLESGWVPADTNAEEFEAVIKEVCEPIFAKPLAEISFAEFVLTLFETAGQFNMELQPQLVLLQKTLLYIEGVGRQLYPELDLWETAQPFMERWAAQHLGPASVINDWINAGPQVWQQLSRLPVMLNKNENELRLLKSLVRTQSVSIAHIETQLQHKLRRRRYQQLAGVCFVGFSVWVLWQPLSESMQGGDLSTLAAVVAAVLGAALLVQK